MLRVDNLSVGKNDYKLDGISFSIESGKCAALMGKSGSGKTMLMEAICGLREINSGSVEIGGVAVTYSAPQERKVGLVPQDNVLFSNMPVEKQIAYGLTHQKWNKKDISARVEEVAHKVKITHLLGRDVKMLSGGEAKRVAIARAIAPKPQLLCLDESFNGLDTHTKSDIMHMLANTINEEKMTTLLISHQVDEADKLAQERFELVKGVIVYGIS